MTDTIETTAVAVREDDNPAHLMRRATDVAGVSREIVMKTAIKIQNRKYVKVEGWTAIAVAHGCIASAHTVERVDTGYRAIGEVRRMSDGVVLATAEGFVGDDEKTWAGRAEYAKRAMAQTRAISRVCRSAFAHVVVLIDANLSTTPAEEMPYNGVEETVEAPTRSESAKPAKVASAASQPPKQAIPEADPMASEAYRKVLLEAFYKLCPKTLIPEVSKFLEDFTWIDGTQRNWLMSPAETIADDLPIEKLRILVNKWDTFRELIDKWIRDRDQIPGAEVEPVTTEEVHLDPTTMGTVEFVSVKEGKKKDGTPWTNYGAKILMEGADTPEWYNTFDRKLGESAQAAQGSRVAFTFERTSKGNTLKTIQAV